MAKKLTIIERIYLTWKAKNDVAKGLFQECNVTDYISVKLNITKDNSKQLSPFIFTELSSFDVQRSSLFNRRYYFIKFINRRLKRGYKFSKAVTKLDNEIVNIETNFSLLEKSYFNKLALLEKECSLRAENKAPEIIQLYEIKKQEEQQIYLQQINCHYNAIIEYLNQKILLMEDMKVRINTLLTYRYLRIRYYYDKSNIAAKKNTISFLTNDDLYNLLQAGFLDEYEKRLNEAYTKRDNIVKKISDNNNSIHQTSLAVNYTK